MSSDSSFDTSELLDASPEKTFSSTIWYESHIGDHRKGLTKSKKDEKSVADNELHEISGRLSDEVELPPINFNRHSYRDQKQSESDSDEAIDVSSHNIIKSNGTQSDSDEEVCVPRQRVIKSNVVRNRLISDSESEANLSDTDTHTKWRKKPVIQSDAESEDEYHSASNSNSESEGAVDASPLSTPPKAEKANKIPETPVNKVDASSEGEEDNLSVSKENHVTDEPPDEVLDVPDSGTRAEFDGNTTKKRTPKGDSPKVADIQSINADSSNDCICLDDTPVKNVGLFKPKKCNTDFGTKVSPPNRAENKQMEQGASGKAPEATLSEIIEKIKTTSLTVADEKDSHNKEKAIQQGFARHNEHQLPVFVLGKKLEGVSVADKNNSGPSGHQKKQLIQMRINSTIQHVARLRKTIKSTNLDVLPDRGQKLRMNLEEEENKLKKLNEEFYMVVREISQDKDGNRQDVPKPFVPKMFQTAFEAKISEASQQPANAGKDKKPSYLGSMPTTVGMGQKALENFRAERSMTIDTLKQLHKSMETCPGEDTLVEDPKLLKSNVTLMQHQKRALAWLLWREAHKPHGGILADDMGLGKTLTMISLILKVKELEETEKEDEKAQESESEDEHDSSWYTSKKKWEKGGTLVVCPASLINQWESEVKNRCKKGTLDVEVFHGSSRETKPRRLARRDMVITTYNIVRSEGAVVTGKRGAGDSYDYTKQGPLFGVKWERVILDEAHQIRNHKSQTSIAACGLRAKHRWALTGTPLHNKDLDLYSLLKFLRCSPFDDLSIWRHWVGNKSAGGMQRLNTVINSLMLRRTKEQLHSKGALGSLSEKHMHEITVKLDKEEFEVYKTVLSLSRSVFQMFLEQRAEKAIQQWEINKKGAQRPTNPYDLNDELKALHQRVSNMQDIKTFEILVLLLRLRQICCLPGLINSMLDEESCKDDSIVDEDGVDVDLMSKLNSLGLDDKENLNSEMQSENKEKKKKVLVVDNPVFDLKRISSKMQNVFKILQEQVLPTGDNIVIVSQWSTLLEIMKGHLKNLGIKCLILTGAIPVKDRMPIIEAFNKPSEKSIVLLLSLTAGGVGLNLIGGNHLFLFDIHWNPQLEAQAFDRVYRVGQTKDVHIYKFICDDTIEQRILALQSKKLALADSILTGVRSKQANKLTLDDLKMLFNLHAT